MKNNKTNTLVGLWSADDVEEVDRQIGFNSFYTQEEKKQILSNAVSRNVISFRRLMLNCIKNEIYLKIENDLIKFGRDKQKL